MAPEIFKGSYDEKVDIWAVGVIFYSMLFKRLPF
jgi:serine/threonine protein kinase